MFARLVVAPGVNEVYVLDHSQRTIRIFNESGMEIFSFGEEGSFGSPSDLAVAEDGSIYILASSWASGKAITRLNYRGEPVEKIDLQNIPIDMEDFRPTKMEYARGSLYLMDAAGLKILVFSVDGLFLAGYDLSEQLNTFNDDQGPRDKKMLAPEISGFSVDEAGTMYFTIPVLFAAFRVDAAGTLETFGAAGSGVGKFGVVAGIATDSGGDLIYVADRLRSVVLVFDKALNFVSEFGFRGSGPGSLIVPDDIVIDTAGKIYVSQGGRRGVSVFQSRMTLDGGKE